MQLTPLQLEIQQRSDKTLSFGCILLQRGSYGRVIDSDQVKVLCRYDNVYHNDSGSMFIFMSDIEHIIGHPMTRGRLLYFMFTYQDDIKKGGKAGAFMDYAEKYPEVFNQTILDWSEDFQLLVKAFLDTLPTDLCKQ